LILEQYRLGELPAEEAARIERLLPNDAALRDRLAALERSDEEIARRYPSTMFTERIRERLAAAPGSTPPPRIGRRLVLVAALTAGAIAIAVALPWRTGAPTPDGDRIKGLTPALAVYRRTAGSSETLADGAAARAGDLLRLGYVSAGRQYGVILSIDGRGIVTVLLPPEGTHAAALRGGGTVLLDTAYELDDAPEWERFYFVTADRPFDIAPVVDAAREAARRTPRAAPPSLPLPRDYDQSTFSIVKEDKP
jgi:hypothetical protein